MVLRGEVKDPKVSGHMLLSSLIYCRHTRVSYEPDIDIVLFVVP